MDLVDLIVGIVVVTILVTVVVGLATYVAYKFRLARQPSRSGEGEGGTRYFFLHEPPEEDPGDGAAAEPAGASGGAAAGDPGDADGVGADAAGPAVDEGTPPGGGR